MRKDKKPPFPCFHPHIKSVASSSPLTEAPSQSISALLTSPSGLLTAMLTRTLRTNFLNVGIRSSSATRLGLTERRGRCLRPTDRRLVVRSQWCRQIHTVRVSCPICHHISVQQQSKGHPVPLASYVRRRLAPEMVVSRHDRTCADSLLPRPPGSVHPMTAMYAVCRASLP